MNLRLLTLSAAASAILIAATPMVPASMSTDNGGTKSAIDAYTDGGGVVIINQAGDTKFDNSAMNGLVFKYGETAKSSNTTLKNQVSVLSVDTTAAEKAISAKFDLAKVVINPPVNGTSCDDWNPQTVSDVWTSGMCNGNNIENQSCNDANIQTINDKYHNGVCGGTNVEGIACDDLNALTYADKYHNGICVGIANGVACDDNNALTFADKYTSGVCAGVANGTTCDDSNVQTINDQYTSGICAGTNVENNACNDSKGETYLDKYHNGVCAGTIATSCKDILTIGVSYGNTNYTIDTDGAGARAPFSVFCNMTADGGGWTMLAQTTGTAYHARDAEASCAAKGLVLFIPRTLGHMQAAVATYGPGYLAIMGIYPKYKGAQCMVSNFTSTGCGNWGPHYGTRWYVQNGISIAEPNGDNDTDGSMWYYNFNANGPTAYNDIDNANGGGYKNTAWLCSHPNEN